MGCLTIFCKFFWANLCVHWPTIFSRKKNDSSQSQQENWWNFVSYLQKCGFLFASFYPTNEASALDMIFHIYLIGVKYQQLGIPDLNYFQTQCYWMIFSSRTRIWLTESPQHCKSEVEERVPYLPQHYSGRTLSGNCDDQLLWVSRLTRLNFQEWMMTWCEYWALVSLLATPIMAKSVVSVVFFNKFETVLYITRFCIMNWI